MKRTLLAIVLALVTALGFITFSVGNAEAWKCDRHPEQPTCTTTTPPPLNSTTSFPPVSVSQPSPSTSLPTTTTSSTVPATTTTAPELPPTNPPTIIRFAG